MEVPFGHTGSCLLCGVGTASPFCRFHFDEYGIWFNIFNFYPSIVIVKGKYQARD
jgi:hypothetical protein